MSDVGSINEWTDLAKKQERGDDNCIPRFYMREVEDRRESEIAGRPKFKLVPFVEIIIPGDKLLRPDRKVSDEDKSRWPQAWDKFEQRQAETYGDGTPIDQWPYLNRAQVAEMRAIGILTVESLAGLGDTGLQKIGMGARDLQKRAQQFLKPQSDRETDLRSEKQALQEELKVLRMEMEHLKKVVEGKPKRGRPPKVTDDSENDLPERA